jgi:hypothetical protein
LYRLGLAVLVLAAVVGMCAAAAGMGANPATAAGGLSVTRHVGGVAPAVYASAGFLLWGKGAELEVYSADGASRLGGLLLPALITDIAVDGGTAYIAARDGLYLVGLANLSQPALLRRIAAPPLGDLAAVSAVAVAGGFAYVGLEDDGLWVIDLAAASGASNAPAGGTVIQAPDHHYVSELYSFAGHLFSVDNASGSPGQPRVWSLSNPSAPADLGRVNTRSDASGLAVAGNYLLISTFFEGLAIYQWNPTQPLTATLASRLPIATGAFDLALTADGQTALLVTEGGLALVDVANRAAPILKEVEPAPVGFASRLAVRADRAFAASGEGALQVFTFSAASLNFAFERGLRGALLAAERSGSAVYLAANSQGLVRLSATNPSSPSLIARVPTGGAAQAVALSGGYVVAGASDEVVLFDGDTLEETGRLALPGFNQAWALAATSDTVYVAAGHAGVCALAVSSGVPKLRACLDTDGEARDVALDGTRLYVADSGNGVVVANVADPDNPQALGRYTSAYALALALAGPQLYVSDFNNGNGRLLLLNRGAGASLNFAAQSDTRGFVRDIETSGDLVYLANEDGLEVLQHSSANSLAGWAWYDSAGGATDVLLLGGQTYLMDGVNGLVILSVTTPAGTPTTQPLIGPYRINMPIVQR